jgi:hypothetical protein
MLAPFGSYSLAESGQGKLGSVNVGSAGGKGYVDVQVEI